MNIISASNKIIQWFSKNDTFNMEDHFKELILISESIEYEKAAVLCALEELKKIDIVRDCQIKTKTYWILFKPIEQLNQNVLLSGNTANIISKIINDFCEATNDTQNICDSKSITDKDINNLLLIVSKIKNIENTKK